MKKNKLFAMLLAATTTLQALPIFAGTITPSHSWITSSWTESGNWRHHSVDGNSTTRWTTDKKGNWIKYDLGQPKSMDQIGIEFFYTESSPNRKYTYTIEVSSDNKKWTKICNRSTSSGAGEGMIYHPVDPSLPVKYVRVTGYGNTDNSWFSVAEVDFGIDPSTITSEEKTGALGLTANDSVRSGKELEVVVSGSNSKSAYAQDITFHYNPEVFEILGITGLDETQIVQYETVAPGTLRILSATDKGLGIVDDIYTITLLAKNIPDTNHYPLTVDSGSFGKVYDGNSTTVDTTSDSITILVIKDPAGNIRPGDINQDHLIDVEDLALVTYYYRATSQDGIWLEAECADTNGDGIIDIQDISFITAQMAAELFATQE